MQNIALDYDDTFTKDPGLWREFARCAIARGHSVAIVTFRGQDDIADIAPNVDGLQVICTDGMPKHASAAKQGFEVDIWIDDWPELIGRTR